MKRAILAALSLCFVACAAGYGEPEDDLADEADEADDAIELGEASQALAAGLLVSFKNQKSGLCIGVDRASVENGALLKQFGCENAPNQRWESSARGGVNEFENDKAVGKCMGVDGASIDPGANIGQFNCGDFAPNQSWALIDFDGDGRFSMVNSKSGLCIGVDRASLDAGAQLKQFECDGAINQDWGLIFR